MTYKGFAEKALKKNYLVRKEDMFSLLSPNIFFFLKPVHLAVLNKPSLSAFKFLCHLSHTNSRLSHETSFDH
jgi:hypothetical protein